MRTSICVTPKLVLHVPSHGVQGHHLMPVCQLGSWVFLQFLAAPFPHGVGILSSCFLFLLLGSVVFPGLFLSIFSDQGILSSQDQGGTHGHSIGNLALAFSLRRPTAHFYFSHPPGTHVLSVRQLATILRLFIESHSFPDHCFSYFQPFSSVHAT